MLGALEQRQSPLRAGDRVLRIDPQNLGGLCIGLIELPQLREIGGQEDVALPHSGTRNVSSRRRGSPFEYSFSI